MFAVTLDNGSLRWEEHPDPVPGTGQLLVSVAAAGLNGADLLQRKGGYPAPAGSPATIPGLEMAGVVVGTGPDVTRFAVGDRVMAVVGGGGQAEQVVIHERTAIAVPDELDWPSAGGFSETFTTAHDALFTQCGLAFGDRLLVHGAAGGVGTAAVQLGRAAGATVIATVRSAELRPEVAALGAEAIDPESFTDHGPFDVILELVGGPNLHGNLTSLATGGRISIIGTQAGGKAELSLGLLMQKRGRIHGSTLRARPLEQKADAAQRVEHHVLPHVRRGDITVPVAATFPMADAESAYDRFAAGAKFGKVVLVRDPG